MKPQSPFKDSTILFRAVSASTESILVTDPHRPDNPIVFANKAFTRLTGYPESEILGKNCRFLQGKDTDPAAVKRMRVSIILAKEIKVTIVNYRKDGERFLNELLITPVKDDAGRLKYFLGIQHEVAPNASA
jgi:PAS domain S-box-containing protein